MSIVVIPGVRPRSANVGDVLRYLFGPGDDGEHNDQRLVGAWEATTVRGICDLQPQSSNGVRSIARLAGLLEQPVLAGNKTTKIGGPAGVPHPSADGSRPVAIVASNPTCRGGASHRLTV